MGSRPVAFRNANHVSIESRIAVQDHVSVRGSLGKRFAQLLDDPVRSRVPSHVEVQDLAASVRDDEKAVEQLEGHRWHRKEVEGDYHLAVILEKREPPLTRVATALNPPQIPGYGPFRDDQAEFLKFSVELGGSPTRVLCRQPPDQRPDLFGDLRPTAARPGTPELAQCPTNN